MRVERTRVILTLARLPHGSRGFGRSRQLNSSWNTKSGHLAAQGSRLGYAGGVVLVGRAQRMYQLPGDSGGLRAEVPRLYEKGLVEKKAHRSRVDLPRSVQYPTPPSKVCQSGRLREVVMP
jgi:hypothetical protein